MSRLNSREFKRGIRFLNGLCFVCLLSSYICVIILNFLYTEQKTTFFLTLFQKVQHVFQSFFYLYLKTVQHCSTFSKLQTMIQDFHCSYPETSTEPNDVLIVFYFLFVCKNVHPKQRQHLKIASFDQQSPCLHFTRIY